MVCHLVAYIPFILSETFSTLRLTVRDFTNFCGKDDIDDIDLGSIAENENSANEGG